MGRPLSQAAQWADSSSIGRRSTFRTNYQTALLIDSVTREVSSDNNWPQYTVIVPRTTVSTDAELITRILPQRMSRLTSLWLVRVRGCWPRTHPCCSVPPNKPVVRTLNQAVALHGAEVGPLEVGDDLVVMCEVSGGSPSPSVTWWKEGSIYDSTYDLTSYGTVVNTMEYHNLRREDLGAKFVCQGSNTNSTPPVSREINVSLYCK